MAIATIWHFNAKNQIQYNIHKRYAEWKCGKELSFIYYFAYNFLLCTTIFN